MDLRLFLVMMVVMGIAGFLLGRRTSPNGRALHRLQRQLDAKQGELDRQQRETSRFVSDVQTELRQVSNAYDELQRKLRSSAEHLLSPEPVVAGLTSTAASAPAPRLVTVTPARRITDQAPAADANPEWSARLVGGWSGRGGPALASAAACPLPDYGVLEAPKDYPAIRRSGHYDEHSYA
ncbi:MAG TPA: DUF1043 family protein [Permianibacter sp.]|nr:DUF1043 family protein [Permianibacter sp.]